MAHTTHGIGLKLEKALAKNGYGFTYSSRFEYGMFELWQMLPKLIIHDNVSYILFMVSSPATVWCYYAYTGFDGLEIIEIPNCESKPSNVCDALANLVIWCIQNNHKLKIEKQNDKG